MIVVEQDTETEMPDGVRRIPLILNVPMGKPACVNAGVTAAKSEHLLIIDADTLIEPSIVNGPPPEPHVMLVPLAAQFALNPATTEEVLAGDPAEFNLTAWLATSMNRSNGLVRYRFSPGGAQLMSKTLFKESGGMNEFYTRWGGDALNFHSRVVKAGGRTKYAPTETYGLHLFHEHVGGHGYLER